jgi:HAE1 family hydrophobic/amphiphilic exporter-1
LIFSTDQKRFISLAAALLVACNTLPAARAQQPQDATPIHRDGDVREMASLTQTPRPTPIPPQSPSQTPAQRDATRPPGTEQRQTDPNRTRPIDPTRPPGTDARPAPQAPPGTQLPPSGRSGQPATQRPEQPSSTVPPIEQPSPLSPDEEPRDPAFPAVQPRPVPPLPSLDRLGVQTGNTVSLSLNDAIRRALENNNDIQVARDDVRYNESVLLGLHGVYDPLFTYTPEINNFVRPVTSIFGGGTATGTVSTTDFNNNFSVTKQFGKGGGNYTYFFNNTREVTNATSATLTPFYSANQGLQFTQPLWRNRSIDRFRQQIRVQRKRLQQSDADFRRSTIEVISQVQRAYWDLVFALRDQENQIANLNLARENFRRTEAAVAAGAAAPLERAEVQTELSNRESQLLASSQQVSVAENNLKRLLLRDPASPDWSAALTPTDTPKFDETPVNLGEAIEEARKNRPEMQRLRIQSEISDIDITYFKNQTKPAIDVNATFSTTGLAGNPAPNFRGGSRRVPIIGGDPNTDPDAFLLQELNRLRVAAGLPPVDSPIATVAGNSVPEQFRGGFGQTLGNLFGFGTRNIVAGVTIQFPFRNRTAEANLAGARILKDQLAATTRAQEQIVEVEVRNSAQAVETARRRVLAAREARRNAELQLQGEQRLYQVGRSTTFLLFQRENALVNARNAELRAETDYNKALADLQRATSTTLRANNVVVESLVSQ